MTMLMIMPPLLLQKPAPKSKSKDHVKFLAKRIIWWKNGEIDFLIREGRAIQERLKKSKMSKEHYERVFVRLMLQGKVSAALRWIGSQSTSVLEATSKVVEDLKKKHPSGEVAREGSILKGPKDKVEPVIYEVIDGSLMCTAPNGQRPLWAKVKFVKYVL